jgi:hypothetical protein
MTMYRFSTYAASETGAARFGAGGYNHDRLLPATNRG